MNRTKEIIIILIGVAILSGFLYVPVLAKPITKNNLSVQELIQSLKQQIEVLKARVEALSEQIKTMKGTQAQIKGTTKEIKQTLRLTRRLWKGMRGEDIEALQEILATDPEIYPEGLVTGYFGPLTEKAIKRFQKMMGVEQVGVVGPKTLSKINELLEEGAGSSGKVPPGLLIAPGIRKKISFIPQPLPGQILPPGIAKKIGMATSTVPDDDNGDDATSTPDIAAPIISELMATSTGATSTHITWFTDEEADSKVWYGTSTPLVITTSTPMVVSSDLVFSHDITLSGLTASTTYYYLVNSADEMNNITTSSEESFTTLPE